MSWIKPDWPLPPGVHAAVSLRDGGVSQGVYASLNPADHVQDDPEHVSRNRQIIREQLQLPAEPVWLQQVHGIQVVKADQIAASLPEADASFTDHTGVVCAVLTADCLPLLFCGDGGSKIAAAHAGWRGLQAGIIEQTLQAMACNEVSVWLGPAIGPEQFEVGDEVRAAFLANSAQHAAAFKPNGPGKWLANIYQLARQQLAALGVGRVYGGDFCTVSDPQRFYSYRRDGAATGRMASLIWRTA
jgi:YfiH family protein